MSERPDWADLNDRFVWGAGMAALGLLAIVFGGVWFQMLAVFAAAVMVWELHTMIAPDKPTPAMLLAALSASVLAGMIGTQELIYLPLLVIPACLGAWFLERESVTFFGFALAILIAGWGLVMFRETFGMVWLIWMVLVVVATDILGYFGGRIIGGPKFWPSLSPKKTWSGTVSGWIGAAIVGAIFLTFTNAGRDLPWISVAVSFASQMGDILESALKRRLGVKDSSSLIPGHGGLFDRFDGLLGAALVLLFVALVVEVPEVRL
ncbi:MAG: phosphatidate cytidylyltransferase [Pseudomonadota bacterium]